MDTTLELEEMRMQLANLKKDLDSQTIVTDMMVRNRLQNASTGNASGRGLLIRNAILLAIQPIVWINLANMGYSVFFCLLIVIAFVWAVIESLVRYRMVHGVERCDLVTAGRRMVRLTHFNHTMFIIDSLFLLVFAVCFVSETFLHRIPTEAVVLPLVLLAICYVVGMVWFFRRQRLNRELIEELHSITEEK